MARSQSSSPSIFTSFIRWLRLKNYQYEVTFALYMLTPMEKFIFNSLLLLIISMFLTAAYIYLPNHVVTIFHHIWYYWAGEPFTNSGSSASAGAVVNKLSDELAPQEVIMETAKIVAETTAKRLAEL